MLLSLSDFRALDQARPIDLLSLEAPEGIQLEFKGELPGKSDDDKKWKVLKEVAGLANAHGGLLLLGVQEPDEMRPPEKRLVGLEDGVAEARTIERVCTAGLEPRVAGLEIQPIPLQDGRAVVAIRVPPSLNKPHLIQRKGKREFYIRHTESVDPMSWFEIREAVLDSATAEERARRAADAAERDTVETLWGTRAVIIAHAIPLGRLDEPWDVFGPEILEAVKRSVLRQSLGVKPKPTLHGIRIDEELSGRIPSVWEVRRSGGIVASAGLPDESPNGPRKVIRREHRRLFEVFAKLSDDLIGRTGGDLPYLVRVRCVNLQSAKISVPRQGYQGDQRRQDFLLGEWLRQPGTFFSALVEEQWNLLYNALGLWPP